MTNFGIELRFSIPSASTGNSQAQLDPGDSLGGYAATTVWSGGSIPLFEDDNLTGTTVYRCLFAANSGSYYTLRTASVYINGTQPGTAIIALGVDPSPASALNAAAYQAQTVVDEASAPTGVPFSSPSYGTAALVLGDLAPMTCRGFWVRRVSTGTVPAADQTVTIRLNGTLTL